MTAETESVVLDIEGMTCASCVHEGRARLGVGPRRSTEASVNLATRTATVRPDRRRPGAFTDAVAPGRLLAPPTHIGPARRTAKDGCVSVRGSRSPWRSRVPVLLLSFLVPDGALEPDLAWALTTPGRVRGRVAVPPSRRPGRRGTGRPRWTP